MVVILPMMAEWSIYSETFSDMQKPNFSGHTACVCVLVTCMIY